ncbi:Uncharacterised protein [Vibrio cholerae]|nr:Uncharacterised protein [Vibrio cholerae]
MQPNSKFTVSIGSEHDRGFYICSELVYYQPSF